MVRSEVEPPSSVSPPVLRVRRLSKYTIVPLDRAEDEIGTGVKFPSHASYLESYCTFGHSSEPDDGSLSLILDDSLFSIQGRRSASQCHPIAAHAAPQQNQFFPRRFENKDMKTSSVSSWPFERGRADIDARGSPCFPRCLYPDTLVGCLEVLAPTQALLPEPCSFYMFGTRYK